MPDTPPKAPTKGPRVPRPPIAGRPQGAPSAPPTARAQSSEPVVCPEGFAPLPGQETTTMVATRDVYLSFVPKHAKRESTVLACYKGQTLTPAEWQRRVDVYGSASRIEFK